MFDGAYIHYFIKYGQNVRKKHGRQLVAFYAALLALFGVAIYFGFGFELFMLWFLPSRITLLLIAVVFVILPHYPAMVAQDEEPYMATTMRYGWEWLLTPLLVYQNYHLIHHLYPEIPFTGCTRPISSSSTKSTDRTSADRQRSESSQKIWRLM